MISPSSTTQSLPGNIVINDNTMQSLTVNLPSVNNIVTLNGSTIELAGDVENSTITYNANGSNSTPAITVNAGDGANIFYAGDNSLPDTLNGGAGNDTFYITGGTHTLAGGAGTNNYVFDPSNGSLITATISPAASGNSDTIDLSRFTTDTTLDLSSTSRQTVSTGLLSLELTTGAGIENVIGGSGDNAVTGNSRSNLITCPNGNNTLTAGSGDSTLVGGNWNNTFVVSEPATGRVSSNVNGGAGDDSLTVNLNSAATTMLDGQQVNADGSVFHYSQIGTLNFDGAGGSYAISALDATLDLPESITIADTGLAASLTLTLGAAVTSAVINDQTITLTGASGTSVITFSNAVTNLTIDYADASTQVTGQDTLPTTVIYQSEQLDDPPISGTVGNDTITVNSYLTNNPNAPPSSLVQTTVTIANASGITYSHTWSNPAVASSALTFTIDGLGGNDTLVLQNSAAWTIQGNKITQSDFTSAFPIIYVQNIENITLQSASSLTFNADAPSTSNSGIDVINVAGTLPAL